MYYGFEGKTVVVTGGSRGIGRRIAERFYMEGANIAVCSRKAADVEAMLTKTDPDGGRSFGMRADTSSVSQLTVFLERTVERLGHIDILVSNAGINLMKPSLEVTEAEWDETIDINLKAHFFASQFAARHMIENGIHGVILYIGSCQCKAIAPGYAVYSAAKAGLSQMTRHFAYEWGKKGLRVNYIGPGSIPTAINAAVYADPNKLAALQNRLPLSRQGTTDEIADAVLFLASDRASYITGQSLLVDGGSTCCP